ncbi:ABC transporter ATP-binding protein [Corynebacterium pseudodiphtheriticum]|uniref:ABC transporter ATP-binding protein n=1 Tax=Corynebacterium pseudodiphtheriticum TaxID=37637 RepID=UPI002550A8D5|nr:ABC transporter ATP-binding protein [Corynebacterium pseudodiphtheriticum]MDK8686241.1 ABC transporter ATP-binding protein [Corynebacterium pseudodiphtheriticum]
MTAFNLLRNNAGLISLGILLSLLSTAVTLLQPALVGQLISGVSSGEFQQPLMLLLLTILGTSVLTAATMSVVSIAADRTVRDMRKKITNHLLYLQVKEFEKGGSGSFTTRVTSDTSIVSTAFSSTLTDFVGGFTVIIGALIYMAVVDWKLLLVVVAVLLVALVIIVVISSSLQNLSSKVQDHLAALGEILQSALSAIRTIKAFRVETKVIGNLSAEIDHAYRNRRRMSFVEAVLEPLSTVASYVALLAVVVFGSMRLSNGDLSGEALTIFVTALFLMLAPIVQVSQSLGTFFEARGALDRINRLFSLEVEDSTGDDSLPEPSSVPPGSIEFESVSYSREGRTILDSATVTVRPGEKVALAGASGAGKTTIFSLLLKFYDVSAGHIRVGGRDLNDWNRKDLRTVITYVEQEPDLLPGTLRENLTLGTENNFDDKILCTLLNQFGLGNFASTDGLDRLVGSGNSGLSGGERQRVAIIRAILQKSLVILVDEPTSALDSVSAELSMNRLLETDSTVIFTSHDTNITNLAERILTVVDGRIVESTPNSRKSSDA